MKSKYLFMERFLKLSQYKSIFMSVRGKCLETTKKKEQGQIIVYSMNIKYKILNENCKINNQRKEKNIFLMKVFV